MWDLLGIDKVWFLITAAFATEAATNLLTKSEFSIRFIKKPLFNWRHIKSCEFFHDLLDCGYCTSVWVALIPAYWYVESNDWLTLGIFALVIHRLSNVIHFLIDVLDEKRIRDL